MQTDGHCADIPVLPIWMSFRYELVTVADRLCAEMVDYMKLVADLDVELTVEERNLLSVAYKNVIGARRASWRIISSIEQKEDKGASAKTEHIIEYRKMVCLPISSITCFL